MRLGLPLALIALTLGCSCSSEQSRLEPERLLTPDQTAAMPTIALSEVTAKLRDTGGKAQLLLLWRADTEESTPCLAEANALAERHAQAGLEVWALNIDSPDVVRDKALARLAELGPTKLKARAYQDDVMGLGATLDYTWGGQTPAAFLYDRSGKQIYKGRGKDSLGEAAARMPKALAAADGG